MIVRDNDTVLRQLVARTIGEAQHIPMAEVTRAAIPSGVKAYLRAHLCDRFQSELSHTDAFARVQPPSPFVSRLHDLVLLHSAEGYVYPREEFLADVENAVRFTENYVCRPRWTLSSFLFHDAPVISTAALFSRLEYVTEYIYLPQLLRRTVSQRKLTEIDGERCTRLIRRIDAAVVREHAPHELALLARPIFRFFLFDSAAPEGPIPLRPILLFFEDKELNGLRDYIQGVCHVGKRETLSLAELVELCEDFLAGPSAGSAGETPAPEPELHPPSPEGIFFDTTQEAATGPVSIEETAPEIFPDPPPEPVIEEIPPAILVAPPPETSAVFSDLDGMITPDQRKRFINVLCDRDADFYELIISRLNIMRTWHEASAYIRELFEINGIEPFRDEAITFTDIVQQRFKTESGPRS